MFVDATTLLVARELAVVVGEGALGHHQVAQLHALCIASADAGHDGDARLALFQHA